MRVELTQKGISVIKPFGQEVMPPIAQICCVVTNLPIRRRFRKDDPLIAIRKPHAAQAALTSSADFGCNIKITIGLARRWKIHTVAHHFEFPRN